MAITNVYKAINRHLRTVDVNLFISESFVDGENVQTFATGINKVVPVIDIPLRTAVIPPIEIIESAV